MLASGYIKDRNATIVWVSIYEVERKQKGVVGLKLEDESLPGRNDFFSWYLREWQII